MSTHNYHDSKSMGCRETFNAGDYEKPDLPEWFRILLETDSAVANCFKERIPHIRQEFDWDCGIVVLQMTLPFCVSKPENWLSSSIVTRNWLESSIGTRSTWTIDLVSFLDCLLITERDQLSETNKFDYLFYSSHPSVNSALATMGFYSRSFMEDSNRVMHKYNSLKLHSEHRILQHDNLSLEVVLTCLRHDNCLVILLVDNTIFQSMINGRSVAYNSPYLGHYILLVRCVGNDQVLVHDPGQSTPIIVSTMALESAWRVPGTDSDAIVIVRNGNFSSNAATNLPSR